MHKMWTFLEKLLARADGMLPSIMAFVILIWAIVGLWWLFACFLEFLAFVYVHFLRRGRRAKQIQAKYGEWVTVVVSSCAPDAMRLAIMSEFARHGFNILLLVVNSRRIRADAGSTVQIEEEMREMHRELKAAGPTPKEMRIVRMELPGSPEKITDLLKQLPAGASLRFFIMLTSAQSSLTHPSDFLEANVLLPTFISKLMHTNSESFPEPGLIVHVASVADRIIFPHQSLLGASQAFLLQISRYHKYYAHQHVKTQMMLCLADPAKPGSLLYTSHGAFAADVLRCVDYDDLVAPSWVQAPLVWLARVLPERLMVLLAWLVSPHHRRAQDDKQA